MTVRLRAQAIELSARFANIGEDPMVSIARAELFYDFLSGAERASHVIRSVSAEELRQLTEVRQRPVPR